MLILNVAIQTQMMPKRGGPQNCVDKSYGGFSEDSWDLKDIEGTCRHHFEWTFIQEKAVDDFESCLKLYGRDTADFLRRYVIIEKTEVSHYTQELNRQSAELIISGEPRPWRPKTQQWASKVLASWDFDRCIEMSSSTTLNKTRKLITTVTCKICNLKNWLKKVIIPLKRYIE